MTAATPLKRRLHPVAVPLIGSVWIIIGAILVGLGALDLYWTAPTTDAAAYVAEDLAHDGVRWGTYLGGGVMCVVGAVAVATGMCFVARLRGLRFGIEMLTWLGLAGISGLITFLGWRVWI
jgi:hypothetical protein